MILHALGLDSMDPFFQRQRLRLHPAFCGTVPLRGTVNTTTPLALNADGTTTRVQITAADIKHAMHHYTIGPIRRWRQHTCSPNHGCRPQTCHAYRGSQAL
jgi:hypothetical protein